MLYPSQSLKSPQSNEHRGGVRVSEEKMTSRPEAPLEPVNI